MIGSPHLVAKIVETVARSRGLTLYQSPYLSNNRIVFAARMPNTHGRVAEIPLPTDQEHVMQVFQSLEARIGQ